MSETKNNGLDRYGTEPFKQQQFGTAGVEGVNMLCSAAGHACFVVFAVTLENKDVGVFFICEAHSVVLHHLRLQLTYVTLLNALMCYNMFVFAFR